MIGFVLAWHFFCEWESARYDIRRNIEKRTKECTFANVSQLYYAEKPYHTGIRVTLQLKTSWVLAPTSPSACAANVGQPSGWLRYHVSVLLSRDRMLFSDQYLEHWYIIIRLHCAEQLKHSMRVCVGRRIDA